MCDATAIFAGSTLLQLGGAFMKSSSDMSGYNKKIRAANAQADAIDKSTVFKYSMTGLQQQQVQNQATVKEGQSRDKLVAATGAASAAAASGGVTGNSVSELYRSFAVATGKDIMSTEADAAGQVGQAQNEKRADEMSAKNQLLAISMGLPDDPTPGIIGNFIGAALGIGNSFMTNTTPVKNGTGGLFGSGGFAGTGRSFG
jgi:hypothetical protein